MRISKLSRILPVQIGNGASRYQFPNSWVGILLRDLRKYPTVTPVCCKIDCDRGLMLDGLKKKLKCLCCITEAFSQFSRLLHSSSMQRINEEITYRVTYNIFSRKKRLDKSFALLQEVRKWIQHWTFQQLLTMIISSVGWYLFCNLLIST